MKLFEEIRKPSYSQNNRLSKYVVYKQIDVTSVVEVSIYKPLSSHTAWIWIWMTKRLGASSDNGFILEKKK